MIPMRDQLIQPKLNADIRVKFETPPGLTEAALRGSFIGGCLVGFVVGLLVACVLLGKCKNA